MSESSSIEELSQSTAEEYLLPKFFDYGFTELQQQSNIELLRSDCATGLSVSASGLSVMGARGYRSVRASHGISEGSMYFEVYIHPSDVSESNTAVEDEQYINPASITRLTQSQLFRPRIVPQSRQGSLVQSPQVRVGFASATENVHFPVGTGQCSFGYRSTDGAKGTMGIWETYGRKGFGVGDVVGCFVHLGQSQPSELGESAVPTAAEQFLAAAGQKLLHPMPSNNSLHSMFGQEPGATPLKTDGFISFYQNGEMQGTAFTQIPAVTLFPMVSLYNESRVSVNFGPDFRFPPPELVQPAQAAVSDQCVQPSDVFLAPAFAWQHCKLAFLRYLLRAGAPEQTREVHGTVKRSIVVKGEVLAEDAAHIVYENSTTTTTDHSYLPPNLLPMQSSAEETGVQEDYLPATGIATLPADLTTELRRLCESAKTEREQLQLLGSFGDGKNTNNAFTSRYTFDHVIAYDSAHKLLRRVVASKLVAKKAERKKPGLKRKRKDQPSLATEIEQALSWRPATSEPTMLEQAPSVFTYTGHVVPTLRLRDQGKLLPNPQLEQQEPILVVPAAAPHTLLTKTAPIE